LETCGVDCFSADSLAVVPVGVSEQQLVQRYIFVSAQALTEWSMQRPTTRRIALIISKLPDD
jgi:hypothetical protein